MKKYLLLTIVAGIMLNIAQSQIDVKKEAAGIDQDIPVVEEFIPNPSTLKNLDGIPAGGLLLIPESYNDVVMAFDPQTGDLIDAAFIVDDVNDFFSTPIHVVQNSAKDRLYVSDQLKDLVQEFDNDGNFLGTFAPAGGANPAYADNIRGMCLKNGSDHLLVSDGNNDAIQEFDAAGNYVGTFGVSGRMDPFDIVYWTGNDQYLVCDIDGGNDADSIQKQGSSGSPISLLVAGIDFPEQVTLLENGNILVAGFSPPSGIYEYQPDGTQVGYYDVITGCRGVYELGNSNWLVTAGTGVYEIDKNNTLISTKYSAASHSFRFITFVEPPQSAVDVTFRVDMQEQTVPPEGVHIAGSFPAPYPMWDPAGILLDPPTSGTVYSVTLQMDPGTYLEFKYINGDAWGEDEAVPPCCAQNGNRFFTVPNENTILPVVCYGNCSACTGTQRDITFQVDLSDVSYTTGAFIAGSLQTPPWTPEPMTNMGNNIFQITIPLEEGDCHQYKFVVDGTGWEAVPAECGTPDGFGGNNRYILVPDFNQTLDLVCLSSCAACDAVDVTFSVDMTGQTVAGNVYVAGSFNNWNSTANPLTDMGSGIWEATITLQNGQDVEYKFINDTEWEIIPDACAWGGNRHFVVPASTTNLDLVCFGSCNACSPTNTFDVTFEVDMSSQLVSGSGVYLAGDFNGWSMTAEPMSDMGGNIWAATVPLGEGFIYGYKFINGDQWEDVPAECNYNGVRTVVVPAANTTLPVDCFNECGACSNTLYTFIIKVLLEGPFNGTGMNTSIFDSGLLPAGQPYNTPPWNYDGQEVLTALPGSGVVDYILVEIRETTGDATTATSDKMLDRQAAVLLADGTIARPDGTPNIYFSGNIVDNLYLVIHHRNHLSIMSAVPLVEASGTFTYNFTDAQSKAYLSAQTELSFSSEVLWGMFGGDSDGSGSVTQDDKDVNWNSDAGITGYHGSDLNLDGQVNNPDKNEIWEPNLGEGTQVPL